MLPFVAAAAQNPSPAVARRLVIARACLAMLRTADTDQFLLEPFTGGGTPAGDCSRLAMLRTADTDQFLFVVLGIVFLVGCMCGILMMVMARQVETMLKRYLGVDATTSCSRTVVDTTPIACSSTAPLPVPAQSSTPNTPRSTTPTAPQAPTPTAPQAPRTRRRCAPGSTGFTGASASSGPRGASTSSGTREAASPSCPQCRGGMVLKPALRGGWFLGCLQYPACRGSRRPNGA